MGSGGPGGQLGNAGVSPWLTERGPAGEASSLPGRGCGVTNCLWLELLNQGGSAHSPRTPEPGQEEQTPRLSPELDSPPPGQRARFSLGFLRPLWLLDPLPRTCLRPPRPTQVPLCAAARRPLSGRSPAPSPPSPSPLPDPEEALSSQSWRREGVGLSSEHPGGSPGARYPRKGAPRLDPACQSLKS